MSNGPLVVVPKYHRLGEGYGRKEQIEASAHPGRPNNPKRKYETPAEWVTGLTALRKVIMLCSFCRHKFNPRKHRYRVMYSGPDATGKSSGFEYWGKCDDCRADGLLTAFQSEEDYAMSSRDPTVARREDRAERYATSVWTAIKRLSFKKG